MASRRASAVRRIVSDWCVGRGAPRRIRRSHRSPGTLATCAHRRGGAGAQRRCLRLSRRGRSRFSARSGQSGSTGDLEVTTPAPATACARGTASASIFSGSSIDDSTAASGDWAPISTPTPLPRTSSAGSITRWPCRSRSNGKDRCARATCSITRAATTPATTCAPQV